MSHETPRRRPGHRPSRPEGAGLGKESGKGPERRPRLGPHPVEHGAEGAAGGSEAAGPASPRPLGGGRIEKVVLVGARASGKSTVGKELAWRLGWSFVDTDVGVAAVVGRAVGAFLAEHGEAAFRAVEAEVVDDALRHPNRAVVALGGGAVTIDAVASALRSLPVLVVWLEAPVAELVRRLRADPIQRPPLTDLPLEEEVRALLARRAARCEALAHIRLETFPANVDACCASLLATIQPLLTGS